eukprot:6156929-Pyramimonas_sp.AAC.1
MAAPTTDQPGHRQSALGQQRSMQQQHQTAMSEMRLLGVDDRPEPSGHLPGSGTAWHPDASPLADHP